MEGNVTSDLDPTSEARRKLGVDKKPHTSTITTA